MKRFFLISFLLVSLLFMAGGVYLKQGLHLKELRIGSATLSNISLQWQRKLVLEIGDLNISLPEKKGATQKQLDLSAVDKIVPVVQWVDRLFTKLSVQRVMINDARATLLYESSLCSLSLASPFADLQATVQLKNNNALLITLEDLTSESFRSQASGTFQVDIERRTGHGELITNLAGLPVTFALTATADGLSFQGKESDVITTITPFVDLFGLSHNIQRWITEYLTGSRYELKTLRGDFPWDNPLHLLESAYAEVRVHGCEYTFAPGLEPIKTEYTDVEFKKGVLGIFPHNSTFYGQDAENSWLDINFNDIDNIMLTAYIKTRAVGNADIMNLLQYYDISLPFVQTKGKTDADLTLAINLNKTEVVAKGRFQIDDGVISFDGHPYEIKNAAVTLQNSLVTIDSIDVSSGDIFRVGVNGFFDAARKNGDIDILLQAFELPVGTSALRLETTGKQPKMQYQIRPDGVVLVASESSWELGDSTFVLGAFSTPFVFKDYSGTLSRTLLSFYSKEKAIVVDAQIQGDFVLKAKKMDMTCLLQKVIAKGIQLKSSDLPVSLRYEKGLSLQVQSESEWQLGQALVHLSPVQGTYMEGVLSLLSDRLLADDYFDAGISVVYDHALAKAEIAVKEPHFRIPALADFFKSDTTLTVQIDTGDEFLHATIPEVDMVIETGENNQWFVELTDLKAAHDRSSLLQRLKLDTGKIRVQSGKDSSYSFIADIPWQYHILVKDNKPIELYHITGTVDKGVVKAHINGELITVEYIDVLQIKSEDISYNLPAILTFIDECLPKKGNDTDGFEFIKASLFAKNSGIYLTPNIRLIADNLSITADKQKVEMEIQNREGNISAEMAGDTFSIQGKDLGDRFLNALSPDARVRGGKMAVAAKGTFHEYSAVFEVRDTVLEELKTLNNILVFMNTIPALITFNIPGFGTSGWSVSSAVLGMKVKHGLATIEACDIHSSQVSIVGTGWIDYLNQTIDMDFNMITQSKKNMNKIPLVGYILVGEEKRPSVTVKVSGDLMDPKVEDQVFREVATLPFGILYRTLALPAYLVAPIFSSDDDEEQPEKEEE